MPLAEINWVELFKGSSGENLGPVVVVVCIFLLVTVSIVGSHWRKARLLRLKEEMVERGFTAQEIAMVINAGQGHDRSSQPTCSFDRTPMGAPDNRKAVAN